jgi:hypothetical protein
VSYRHLITGEALYEADPSAAIVADKSESLGSEMKGLIESVTTLIEGHLGLDGPQSGLIVRRHTQAIERHQWTGSDALDGWVAWANQRPVLQIDAGGDDLSGIRIARTDPYRLARGAPEAGTITYFGGFRRPDQAIRDASVSGAESELPTGSSEPLEGLTTLPPTLPGAVQGAAAHIALHVLQNRKQGRLGRRTQQSFGSQQVTIEGADPQYVRRQLGRLDTLRARRLVV